MSEDHYDYDDLPAGDGILILSPAPVILSATLQAERLVRVRFTPARPFPCPKFSLDPLFSEAAARPAAPWILQMEQQ